MKTAKIVVTNSMDFDAVYEKVDGMNEGIFLLEAYECSGESAQSVLNQKTNFMAQKFMKKGWVCGAVKYYKGKLLKVKLQRAGV